MPQILHLVPSLDEYDFTTEIDGYRYAFTVQWNERDESWYLSAFELDSKPIALGMKAVLGAFLGRTCRHRLTSAGALIVVDTSGADRDAGLDDFGDGARVLVTHWTSYEIASAVRAFSAGRR